MRGDESRCFGIYLDKPDRPDLQARAVRRLQRAIHHIAGPALFLARLHDFILGHMLPQLTGHMLPRLNRKTELVEEARFAAPGGMGRIQQVATYLRLWHIGFICVRDFHLGCGGLSQALRRAVNDRDKRSKRIWTEQRVPFCREACPNRPPLHRLKKDRFRTQVRPRQPRRPARIPPPQAPVSAGSSAALRIRDGRRHIR